MMRTARVARSRPLLEDFEPRLLYSRRADRTSPGKEEPPPVESIAGFDEPTRPQPLGGLDRHTLNPAALEEL